MTFFRSLGQFFFNPYAFYKDPLARRQARGVLVVTWLVLAGSVLWLAFQLANQGRTPMGVLIPVIGIIAALVVFVSLRVGANQVAGHVLVFLLGTAGSFVILFTDAPDRIIHVLIPMITAGMLLRRGGVIVTGVMLILVALLDVVLRFNLGQVDVLDAVQLSVAYTLILGLATSIQAIFVGQQRVLAENSLDRVDNLMRVLRTNEAVNVGMTENDVLTSMIRTLRESYQLDVVQVYLIDDEQQLSQLVRAGMRRTEVIVLEGDEVLTLGDTHPISDAARFRQPIHINRESIPKRREYFMPSIQSGLAVPLVDGERLLGVVDLQSVDQAGFSQQEIETLALVIGNFATLVHAIQAQDTMQRSLREQEQTVNRLQSQLATLQAQRQQMVSNVWGEYIEQRGRDLLGFDIQDGTIYRAEEMPPAMAEALRKGETYITVEDDEKLLSVPILLRGEKLGAMTFSLPVGQAISDRQIELANTIALRLGSALESNRLLEQTQQQATRERKATEVASLLFSATDVNSLLRIAADSFNDSLGAIQTRIFVEPNPSPRRTTTNGQSQNGDGA